MKKKIVIIISLLTGLLLGIFISYLNSQATIGLTEYSNIEITRIATSEIKNGNNTEQEVRVSNEKGHKIMDLILRKTYARRYGDISIASYSTLKLIDIQCKVKSKNAQEEFINILVSNTGKVSLRNYTLDKNSMYGLNSKNASLLYDEILGVLKTE